MSTKNFLEDETRKKFIDPVLQQAWWEKDDEELIIFCVYQKTM